MSGLPEQGDSQLLIDDVVLNQQDLQRLRSARPMRHLCLGERFSTRRHAQGCIECERGALAQRTVDPQITAHGQCQAPGNGQPQAGATIASCDGAVGLGEGFKNSLQLDRFNADPSIDHLESDASLTLAGPIRAHLQPDRAMPGEFQRIADQIGQHLPHPQRIADDTRRHIVFDTELQVQAPGLRLWLIGAQQLGQHGLEFERHRLHIHTPGLDLGEVEDVVDDAQQRIGRCLDQRQMLMLLLGQRRREHQFAQPEDGIHGRANLVTHVGKKFALGAIGGFGIQLGPHQRAATRLPFTHKLRQHFRHRRNVITVALDRCPTGGRHQTQQQPAQGLQCLLATGEFLAQTQVQAIRLGDIVTSQYVPGGLPLACFDRRKTGVEHAIGLPVCGSISRRLARVLLGRDPEPTVLPARCMPAADVSARQQFCNRCPQQCHRRPGQRGGCGRIGIYDDALGIQCQHTISYRMQGHIGLFALRLQGGRRATQHVECAPDFDGRISVNHARRIDATVANFGLEVIDALEVAHPAKDRNADHRQTEGETAQAQQQGGTQHIPDFSGDPFGSEDQSEHAVVAATGTDDRIDRLQTGRRTTHNPFRRLTVKRHFRRGHLDAPALQIDERRVVEG